MKKLLACGLSILAASTSFAFTETREINKSSFTATNQTLGYIAGTGPSTDLRGVVVSSVTSAGVLTIFDSSGTATNKVAVIDLGTAQSPHFNVVLSSGLTYTTTGNSVGGVVILYKNN